MTKLTAEQTVQARKEYVHEALLIALMIGRHEIPHEMESGICAELLTELVLATSLGELRSAYLGLYARLAAAGLEPPPRRLH